MKLPIISGEEMIKILAKQGFKDIRRKGSHVSLYKKNNKNYLVVVPIKKEIKKGTLLSIMR